MLDRHQYLVEPSSAVTVAAILTGKAGRLDSPAVAVVSGRNVALATIRRILRMKIVGPEEIRRVGRSRPGDRSHARGRPRPVARRPRHAHAHASRPLGGRRRRGPHQVELPQGREPVRPQGRRLLREATLRLDRPRLGRDRRDRRVLRRRRVPDGPAHGGRRGHGREGARPRATRSSAFSERACRRGSRPSSTPPCCRSRKCTSGAATRTAPPPARARSASGCRACASSPRRRPAKSPRPRGSSSRRRLRGRRCSRPPTSAPARTSPPSAPTRPASRSSIPRSSAARRSFSSTRVAQCAKLGELQHALSEKDRAIEIGAFCASPSDFDRERRHRRRFHGARRGRPVHRGSVRPRALRATARRRSRIGAR